MIEAECKIEGWIAEPGAFGVDEDRAFGPDENVLRADIAMDDGQPGTRGRLGEFFQRCGAIGMRPRRCQEIGFEAQGMEDRVGRELRRGGRRSRENAVDICQAPADFGCGLRDDMPLPQLLLPALIGLRRQILHGENPGIGILR